MGNAEYMGSLIKGRQELLGKMANSWNNRVKFIVRYMYDYDGNGVLDQNDFECLAVRNTVMEGKGDWDPVKYEKNKAVMINLWQQIADIADFDKNGEVDTEEFMGGVETACKGKAYEDLDEAFKRVAEADNLSLARYKDLYAQFLGNPDESCVACSLFGPLPEL